MSDNIRIRVRAVGLEQDITNQARKAEKAVSSRPFSVSLDEKGFSQPLGRITGQMGEFEKSMDAAVARVFAFGAAVSIINAVSDSLKYMAESAIAVEKALADVNVLFNASSQELAAFGQELFDIAENTVTPFEEVATAAAELARQGLSSEETLTRISDAMILARLSGLDAEKSVSTLTATLNGFNSTAIQSADVVNTLANVDAAFAVSTKDLADGLGRAGATAQGAKVEFNELLAAITSVQQQTARGGAVIGNAFKSIFTRLQRSDVQDSLNELGVATQDAAGNFRATMDVLQDYANIYGTLTDAQKAHTDELIAGVFQVNNLKALVRDLNSEYSIYGRALDVANNTTNEATKRNEELNKTMAAMLGQTKTSILELASSLGEITLGPGIEKVLEVVKGLTDGLNNILGDQEGSNIGKTLLQGIGAFISGPGLVILGGAFLKIFAFVAKQGSDALKSIFTINSEAKRQEGIQAAILQILTKNEQIMSMMLNDTTSQTQKEQAVLNILKQQTQERLAQEAFLKKMASSQAFKNIAITPMGQVVPYGRGSRARQGRQDLGIASEGYVPNFIGMGKAGEKGANAVYETSGIGRAHSGFVPSFATKDSKHFTTRVNEAVSATNLYSQPVGFDDTKVSLLEIGGKTEKVVTNTKEKVYSTGADVQKAFGLQNRPDGGMVVPPQSSLVGRQVAAEASRRMQNAAGGQIPNFAKGGIDPKEYMKLRNYTRFERQDKQREMLRESLKRDSDAYEIFQATGKVENLRQIPFVVNHAGREVGLGWSAVRKGSEKHEVLKRLDKEYPGYITFKEIESSTFKDKENFLQVQADGQKMDEFQSKTFAKMVGRNAVKQTKNGKYYVDSQKGIDYVKEFYPAATIKQWDKNPKMHFLGNFKPSGMHEDIPNFAKGGIDPKEYMKLRNYTRFERQDKQREMLRESLKRDSDAYEIFQATGKVENLRQIPFVVNHAGREVGLGWSAVRKGSEKHEVLKRLDKEYPGYITFKEIESSTFKDKENFLQVQADGQKMDEFQSKTFAKMVGRNAVKQTKNGKYYVDSQKGIDYVKEFYPAATIKQWDKNPKMHFLGNFKPSGMHEDIPNFAIGGDYFDFDDTLATFPKGTQRRDTFGPASVQNAIPTPLAQELVGQPVKVLTARASDSAKNIEMKLKEWGITPEKIITTDSMFKDLKIAADGSGKIIRNPSRKGRVQGYRNLKASEKKALLLERMWKKVGGHFNLIDDSESNIRAIQALANSSITGRQYTFDGQKSYAAAKGEVPNFAKKSKTAVVNEKDRVKQIDSLKVPKKNWQLKMPNKVSMLLPQSTPGNKSKLETASYSGAKMFDKIPREVHQILPNASHAEKLAMKKKISEHSFDFSFSRSGVQDLEKDKSVRKTIDDRLTSGVGETLMSVAHSFVKQAKMPVNMESVEGDVTRQAERLVNKSSALAGRIFEDAITVAIGGAREFETQADSRRWDFVGREDSLGAIFDRRVNKFSDAKRSGTPQAIESMSKKMLFGTKEGMSQVRRAFALVQPPERTKSPQGKYGGFIPNFANPLMDAVSRERAAGVPANRIRVDKSPKLKSPKNPQGLAVINTRDEPLGVHQGIKRAKSMGIDPKTHGIYAEGRIPNFAASKAEAITSVPHVASGEVPEYMNLSRLGNKNSKTFDQLLPFALADYISFKNGKAVLDRAQIKHDFYTNLYHGVAGFSQGESSMYGSSISNAKLSDVTSHMHSSHFRGFTGAKEMHGVNVEDGGHGLGVERARIKNSDIIRSESDFNKVLDLVEGGIADSSQATLVKDLDKVRANVLNGDYHVDAQRFLHNYGREDILKQNKEASDIFKRLEVEFHEEVRKINDSSKPVEKKVEAYNNARSKTQRAFLSELRVKNIPEPELNFRSTVSSPIGAGSLLKAIETSLMGGHSEDKYARMDDARKRLSSVGEQEKTIKASDLFVEPEGVAPFGDKEREFTQFRFASESSKAAKLVKYISPEKIKSDLFYYDTKVPQDVVEKIGPFVLEKDIPKFSGLAEREGVKPSDIKWKRMDSPLGEVFRPDYDSERKFPQIFGPSKEIVKTLTESGGVGLVNKQRAKEKKENDPKREAQARAADEAKKAREKGLKIKRDALGLGVFLDGKEQFVIKQNRSKNAAYVDAVNVPRAKELGFAFGNWTNPSKTEGTSEKYVRGVKFSDLSNVLSVGNESILTDLPDSLFEKMRAPLRTKRPKQSFASKRFGKFSNGLIPNFVSEDIPQFPGVKEGGYLPPFVVRNEVDFTGLGGKFEFSEDGKYVLTDPESAKKLNEQNKGKAFRFELRPEHGGLLSTPSKSFGLKSRENILGKSGAPLPKVFRKDAVLNRRANRIGAMSDGVIPNFSSENVLRQEYERIEAERQNIRDDIRFEEEGSDLGLHQKVDIGRNVITPESPVKFLAGVNSVFAQETQPEAAVSRVMNLLEQNGATKKSLEEAGKYYNDSGLVDRAKAKLFKLVERHVDAGGRDVLIRGLGPQGIHDDLQRGINEAGSLAKYNSMKELEAKKKNIKFRPMYGKNFEKSILEDDDLRRAFGPAVSAVDATTTEGRITKLSRNRRDYNAPPTYSVELIDGTVVEGVTRESIAPKGEKPNYRKNKLPSMSGELSLEEKRTSFGPIPEGPITKEFVKSQGLPDYMEGAIQRGAGTTARFFELTAPGYEGRGVKILSKFTPQGVLSSAVALSKLYQGIDRPKRSGGTYKDRRLGNLVADEDKVVRLPYDSGLFDKDPEVQKRNALRVFDADEGGIISHQISSRIKEENPSLSKDEILEKTKSIKSEFRKNIEKTDAKQLTLGWDSATPDRTGFLLSRKEDKAIAPLKMRDFNVSADAEKGLLFMDVADYTKEEMGFKKARTTIGRKNSALLDATLEKYGAVDGIRGINDSFVEKKVGPDGEIEYWLNIIDPYLAAKNAEFDDLMKVPRGPKRPGRNFANGIIPNFIKSPLSPKHIIPPMEASGWQKYLSKRVRSSAKLGVPAHKWDKIQAELKMFQAGEKISESKIYKLLEKSGVLKYFGDDIVGSGINMLGMYSGNIPNFANELSVARVSEGIVPNFLSIYRGIRLPKGSNPTKDGVFQPAPDSREVFRASDIYDTHGLTEYLRNHVDSAIGSGLVSTSTNIHHSKKFATTNNPAEQGFVATREMSHRRIYNPRKVEKVIKYLMQRRGWSEAKSVQWFLSQAKSKDIGFHMKRFLDGDQFEKHHREDEIGILSRSSFSKTDDNLAPFAGGLIPNFSKRLNIARVAEATSASSLYSKPVSVADTMKKTMEIGGQMQSVVVNNKEKFYKDGAAVQKAFNLPVKPDGGMVLPPVSAPIGRKRKAEFSNKVDNLANGFVPNFNAQKDKKQNILDLTKFTSRRFAMLTPQTVAPDSMVEYKVRADNLKQNPTGIRLLLNWQHKGLKESVIKDKSEEASNVLIGRVEEFFAHEVSKFSASLGMGRISSPDEILKDHRNKAIFNQGSVRGAAGDIFESAVNIAFRSKAKAGAGGDFDVRKPSAALRKLFNWTVGDIGDLKIKEGDVNSSFSRKVLMELKHDGILNLPTGATNKEKAPILGQSGAYKPKGKNLDRYNEDVERVKRLREVGYDAELPSVLDYQDYGTSIPDEHLMLRPDVVDKRIKAAQEKLDSLGKTYVIDYDLLSQSGKGSRVAFDTEVRKISKNPAIGKRAFIGRSGAGKTHTAIRSLGQYGTPPIPVTSLSQFSSIKSGDDVIVVRSSSGLNKTKQITDEFGAENVTYVHADKNTIDKRAGGEVDLIKGETRPKKDRLNAIRYGLKDLSYKDEEKLIELIRSGKLGKINLIDTSQSSGIIPNFANSALSDAISRERAAGIPISQIRVEQSPRLVNEANPMGLGVTNTKDEPRGIEQGISRAVSMGINPQTHGINRGISQGIVPNFSNDEEEMRRERRRDRISQGLMFAPMVFGGLEGEAGTVSGASLDALSSASMAASTVSTFSNNPKAALAAGVAAGTYSFIANLSKELETADGKIKEVISSYQRLGEASDGLVNAQQKLNSAMASGNEEQTTKALEQFRKEIAAFPTHLDGGEELRSQLLAANGDISKMTEVLAEFQKEAREFQQIASLKLKTNEINRDERKGVFFGFGPKQFAGLEGKLKEGATKEFKKVGQETAAIEKFDFSSKDIGEIGKILNEAGDDAEKLKAGLIDFSNTLPDDARADFAEIINEFPTDGLHAFAEGMASVEESMKVTEAVSAAFKTAAISSGVLASSLRRLTSGINESLVDLNQGIKSAFALAENQFKAELSILEGLNIITSGQRRDAETGFNIRKVETSTAIQNENLVAEYIKSFTEGKTKDELRGEDSSVFSGKLGDYLSSVSQKASGEQAGDIRFNAADVLKEIADTPEDKRTDEQRQLIEQVKALNASSQQQISLLKQRNQIASRQEAIAQRVKLNRSQIDLEQVAPKIGEFRARSRSENSTLTLAGRDAAARSTQDVINLLKPLFGETEELNKLEKQTEEKVAFGNVVRILESFGVNTSAKIDPDNPDKAPIGDVIRDIESVIKDPSRSKEEVTVLKSIAAGLRKQESELSKTAPDVKQLEAQTVKSVASSLNIDLDAIGVDLGNLDFNALTKVGDELGDRGIQVKLLSSIDEGIKTIPTKFSESIDKLEGLIGGIQEKDDKAISDKKAAEEAKDKTRREIQSLSAENVSVNAPEVTLPSISEIKVSGASSVGGVFVPHDAPDPLQRAIAAERAAGGQPKVDKHPSMRKYNPKGLYVRDASIQKNFADVKRTHPEGMRKAAKNSLSSQVSGVANKASVPNFAPVLQIGSQGQAALVNSANLPVVPAVTTAAPNTTRHGQALRNQAQQASAAIPTPAPASASLPVPTPLQRNFKKKDFINDLISGPNATTRKIAEKRWIAHKKMMNQRKEFWLNPSTKVWEYIGPQATSAAPGSTQSISPTPTTQAAQSSRQLPRALPSAIATPKNITRLRYEEAFKDAESLMNQIGVGNTEKKYPAGSAARAKVKKALIKAIQNGRPFDESGKYSVSKIREMLSTPILDEYFDISGRPNANVGVASSALNARKGYNYGAFSEAVESARATASARQSSISSKASELNALRATPPTSRPAFAKVRRVSGNAAQILAMFGASALASSDKTREFLNENILPSAAGYVVENTEGEKFIKKVFETQGEAVSFLKDVSSNPYHSAVNFDLRAARKDELKQAGLDSYGRNQDVIEHVSGATISAIGGPGGIVGYGIGATGDALAMDQFQKGNAVRGGIIKLVSGAVSGAAYGSAGGFAGMISGAIIGGGSAAYDLIKNQEAIMNVDSPTKRYEEITKLIERNKSNALNQISASSSALSNRAGELISSQLLGSRNKTDYAETQKKLGEAFKKKVQNSVESSVAYFHATRNAERALAELLSEGHLSPEEFPALGNKASEEVSSNFNERMSLFAPEQSWSLSRISDSVEATLSPKLKSDGLKAADVDANIETKKQFTNSEEYQKAYSDAVSRALRSAEGQSELAYDKATQKKYYEQLGEFVKLKNALGETSKSMELHEFNESFLRERKNISETPSTPNLIEEKSKKVEELVDRVIGEIYDIRRYSEGRNSKYGTVTENYRLFKENGGYVAQRKQSGAEVYLGDLENRDRVRDLLMKFRASDRDDFSGSEVESRHIQSIVTELANGVKSVEDVSEAGYSPAKTPELSETLSKFNDIRGMGLTEVRKIEQAMVTKDGIGFVPVGKIQAAHGMLQSALSENNKNLTWWRGLPVEQKGDAWFRMTKRAEGLGTTYEDAFDLSHSQGFDFGERFVSGVDKETFLNKVLKSLRSGAYELDANADGKLSASELENGMSSYSLDEFAFAQNEGGLSGEARRAAEAKGVTNPYIGEALGLLLEKRGEALEGSGEKFIDISDLPASPDGLADPFFSPEDSNATREVLSSAIGDDMNRGEIGIAAAINKYFDSGSNLFGGDSYDALSSVISEDGISNKNKELARKLRDEKLPFHNVIRTKGQALEDNSFDFGSLLEKDPEGRMSLGEFLSREEMMGPEYGNSEKGWAPLGRISGDVDDYPEKYFQHVDKAARKIDASSAYEAAKVAFPENAEKRAEFATEVEVVKSANELKEIEEFANQNENKIIGERFKKKEFGNFVAFADEGPNLTNVSHPIDFIVEYTKSFNQKRSKLKRDVLDAEEELKAVRDAAPGQDANAFEKEVMALEKAKQADYAHRAIVEPELKFKDYEESPNYPELRATDFGLGENYIQSWNEAKVAMSVLSDNGSDDFMQKALQYRPPSREEILKRWNEQFGGEGKYSTISAIDSLFKDEEKKFVLKSNGEGFSLFGSGDEPEQEFNVIDGKKENESRIQHALGVFARRSMEASKDFSDGKSAKGLSDDDFMKIYKNSSIRERELIKSKYAKQLTSLPKAVKERLSKEIESVDRGKGGLFEVAAGASLVPQEIQDKLENHEGLTFEERKVYQAAKLEQDEARRIVYRQRREQGISRFRGGLIDQKVDRCLASVLDKIPQSQSYVRGMTQASSALDELKSVPNSEKKGYLFNGFIANDAAEFDGFVNQQENKKRYLLDNFFQNLSPEQSGWLFRDDEAQFGLRANPAACEVGKRQSLNFAKVNRTPEEIVNLSSSYLGLVSPESYVDEEAALEQKEIPEIGGKGPSGLYSAERVVAAQEFLNLVTEKRAKEINEKFDEIRGTARARLQYMPESVENRRAQVDDLQRLATFQNPEGEVSEDEIGALLAENKEYVGDEVKNAASGYIPKLNNLRGARYFDATSEVDAAAKAGYKTAVGVEDVSSMRIPGEGEVVYNNQEDVFKLPGMNQPFIVPPANSRAANPYAQQVMRLHGFDPYENEKSNAAGGFVPNFAPSSAGTRGLDVNKELKVEDKILKVEDKTMLVEDKILKVEDKVLQVDTSTPLQVQIPDIKVDATNIKVEAPASIPVNASELDRATAQLNQVVAGISSALSQKIATKLEVIGNIPVNVTGITGNLRSVIQDSLDGFSETVKAEVMRAIGTQIEDAINVELARRTFNDT